MRTIILATTILSLATTAMAGNGGTCPPSICDPEEYGHPEWTQRRQEQIETQRQLQQPLVICETQYMKGGNATACYNW